jgi:hypothetical protein
MSKLIGAVLAAAFAVATVCAVAFAQTKEEKPAASKAAVEDACMGMKPGDVVKVDGKNVKCPAPKSASKSAQKSASKSAQKSAPKSAPRY